MLRKLLNFIRPFLAMAELTKASFCSFGLSKRFLISLVVMAVAQNAVADGEIDLKDITSGAYYADNLRSMKPLERDVFVQVSPDGDKLLKYSFKTGENTGVLFDAGKTKGESIRHFDDYEISEDGQWILLATNTSRIYRHSFTAEYYVYETATRHLSRLSKYGKQQAPVWSPDSKRVAFVRDNNIFVVNVTNGKEEQITTDGKFGEIINGIPDWVNEEEFGFSHAMAFTRDGSHLAWIRYDESKVKTYSLQLFKGLRPSKLEYEDYPGEYSYKYPKAGQDNAVVTAWCRDIEGHQTSQVSLPLDADGYIPRILTGITQSDILLYTMNRHQDDLRVYDADTKTAQCRQLLQEKADKYVKEDALNAFVYARKFIFMLSDRDGFMQIYKYDLNGKLLQKVTTAKYGVDKIYGYDEASQNIYYQAAGQSSIEREVYMTSHNGKRTLCLTPRKGWNQAIFSSDYQYYVSTWSDMSHPYECFVCDKKGNTIRQVVDNKGLKKTLSNLSLPSKEMFTFTTTEGVSLNGFMVKPDHFSSDKKYPVIMYQYSGPGSQQVVNSWSIGSMGQGALFDLYLAQKGYIVVCVDGRGTGGRGSDFEKCTYLHIGDLEAHDQVETAIYLASLPYVDADNIGIWGWSYGGFCTLMSMSEGRPVFKAGVAVAPPTNWKFYDSIYTERFMRTPEENPDGYAVNPIVWAPNLHGDLLICHGLADDNVHPQNTFEYSEALVQQDKDFKELIYTNRNHSIYGGNTRYHLLRNISEFFFEHLER